MPIRSLACLCVASLYSLSAAAAPQHAPAARGQQEFIQSCGFCHGNDATGARGPDLVRSPLVNRDLAGDLIGPLIHNGRPDRGMPALPLSDSTIQDIVAFLHARVLDGLHSAHVSGDYPLARLLSGNAEAGRAFFDGAGKCGSCHSATGDLAHVASKYAPLYLEERILAPRPPGHAPATVTTSSGEQIRGKIDHLDEFTVSIRDASGWYHSWLIDQVRVNVQDPLQFHHDMVKTLTDSDLHNLFAYLETLK